MNEDLVIKAVKKITGRIPEYLMFVHPVKSVRELLQTDAVDFEEHFGVTIEQFQSMVDGGLIIESRLDRVIEGFMN